MDLCFANTLIPSGKHTFGNCLQLHRLGMTKLFLFASALMTARMPASRPTVTATHGAV